MKKTALSIATDSLIEQIVDPRNMNRAWQKVKANRRAPGPDRVTLKAFPTKFAPHKEQPSKFKLTSDPVIATRSTWTYRNFSIESNMTCYSSESPAKSPISIYLV